MCRTDPLILGAGPAGSAAAIMLARGGAQPLILERDAHTGDAICGGFISWRTLATLERLGLAIDKLGGHRVTHLVLFTSKSSARARLPRPAIGISRQRLDTLLLEQAIMQGAAIERGVNIRSIEPSGEIRAADGSVFDAESLFIATGKHDVRGVSRDRDGETTVGIRVLAPAHRAMRAMIGDTIELHLFPGGYCGVMINERGEGNICMAVRKSLLTRAGGVAALLAWLGTDNPALGERLAFADARTFEAISAVPYGWIAPQTLTGQFRLGDQAAVIPSLAGEGNGIALASGIMAASAWLDGGAQAAPLFQQEFAAAARRPVGTAMRLWHFGETRIGGQIATQIITLAPSLAGYFAGLTRIDA